MPLTLDTEIAAALALAAEAGPAPTTPRGDVHALRTLVNTALAAIESVEAESPHVTFVDHSIAMSDGAVIAARWYTKAGSRPGSAVLYVHGGGMIAGSVELYHRFVARNVDVTGVPFLSVDYRLAPEFAGTCLVDDAYAGLVWLVEHAAELGIDPTRIAVMGDSGGGGVAAGVAIAARDSAILLAKQILIYPMLDDRNVAPDPHLSPMASWTYDNNFTGWSAVLGDDLGSDRVSPLAAPARLENFDDLAPAYVDVGDLDIFRDEGIRYALNLLQAGVSTELHVRPGCIHSFDRFAPGARPSAASWSDRCRAITTI
ncbi:Alpha/beta hydrolase domain-containing protein [metagenome]|uniref:Alpha/beta hydrolase domain-containing protein n=1 Tax=metagenome TaxID=256318 RepID=A0A2P2C292_9ZZZZ